MFLLGFEPRILTLVMYPFSPLPWQDMRKLRALNSSRRANITGLVTEADHCATGAVVLVE